MEVPRLNVWSRRPFPKMAYDPRPLELPTTCSPSLLQGTWQGIREVGHSQILWMVYQGKKSARVTGRLDNALAALEFPPENWQPDPIWQLRGSQ